MTSLQPESANLAAQYAASWMMPKRPPTLPTLTMRPEPARQHRGQDREAHAHRRVEVEGHHPVDLGGGQVGDALPLPHGRVVHEHVEAAEGVPRLARDGFRAGEVAEVRHPQARGGRVPPARREDLLEPFAAPRHDADGGAALGEHGGERRADAGGRAGDQDARAGERHVPSPNFRKSALHHRSGPEADEHLAGDAVRIRRREIGLAHLRARGSGAPSRACRARSRPGR